MKLRNARSTREPGKSLPAQQLDLSVGTRRRSGLVFGAVFLLAALVLQAAEKYSLPPETAGFKTGPGAEIAMSQCLLCHSADYVSTQPRLPRTAWKATVQKMRDKYGAPLPEDKMETLVDYLAKTYGTDAPKPR